MLRVLLPKRPNGHSRGLRSTSHKKHGVLELRTMQDFSACRACHRKSMEMILVALLRKMQVSRPLHLYKASFGHTWWLFESQPDLLLCSTEPLQACI